ncbi:MAG: ABC transporter ATP-binding protein/permease [Oscillospiraceae bacterium]|nr:ABC transporter ATP-binding protein/permease [Oscillospiraceae bacterium]
MIKLFNILLKKWHIAAVIVAFLAFQAFCELELPGITADIVNIGIQQSGITSHVPEKVEYERMGHLLLIVKDPWKEADILDCYSLTDGGVYELRESVYESDKFDELEKLLLEPLAIVLFAETMTPEAFAEIESNEQVRAMFGELPISEESLDEYASDIRNMLEKGEINYYHPFVQLILELVKSRIIANVDPMILRQSAIMQTRGELVAAGVDVSQTQMDYIYKAGFRMVLFALGSMAAAVTVSFLASVVAAAFSRSARRSVFEKVLRFSGKELDSFSSASLITRCTNDVQQVQWVLSYGARILIFAPMMGVGAFFKVIASESGAQMGWVIGLAIGLIFAIVITLIALAMPRFNRIQPMIDRLNLISREILSGLPVIRAFSREEHEKKRFDKANTDLTKINLFVNRLMTAMFPTMMFVMNGVCVLIIWVGASHIDSGNMQIGDLMAFINYTMQIIMSFLMLSMMSVILPRAIVSFRRIAKVLDTDISVTEPESPVVLTASANAGLSVEFRNVSFKYHNAEDPAVSGISFVANPGETVAIIGATGSGKSTLANLIPRFFDPTEGEILVGGVDIRKVTLRELRGQIAYVPQKTSLFSGTVKSNISYADENMNDERIIGAARIAQAEEFVLEKESGYDEVITQGGGNISGGQKQRLSIARAIAKQAGIYIFDDSFSALDFKTDAAIRRALNDHVSTYTVIIIAQRISTVMNADKIVVLDDGVTAGIGSHAELLKNCETYRQIALSQLSSDELGGGVGHES